MPKQNLTTPNGQSDQWNQVAKSWPARGYANAILAEHKIKTYLNLLARWADVANSESILKTDLFEEAFGQEQFLSDIARVNKRLVGIDISKEIVDQARKQAEHYGLEGNRFICGDVRQLPFLDNSFHLIISNSTLDHFPSEQDIVTTLKELRRVLRVGSSLILTIDNKSNLTYPPYIFIRLWMWLGLAPYFIGKTLSPKELWHNLEATGFEVAESTAIFHYFHPDKLVRWLESTLRRISRGKLDNSIRKCLALLDRLENRKTKYLTGRYIAVKAIKKEVS